MINKPLFWGASSLYAKDRQKQGIQNRLDPLPEQKQPTLPVREKMIAVLGSTKDNSFTRPYFLALQQIAQRLSEKGYGIITGASAGANYYGNLGAPLRKSFAIHVRNLESVENRRPNGKEKLYQDYETVLDGAKRTQRFNQLCDTFIVTPGGPGSLEEIAVTLENIYYKVPGAPKHIILLGMDFWNPLKHMMDNMINKGLAEHRLRNIITFVDIPLNDPEAAATKVENIIRKL